MNRNLIALLAGSLFGAGLAWSGMADPRRVQAFLDVLGNWDPTLAFVMAGAIMPMVIAWRLQKRLERPFADAHFDLPGATRLDAKLALGAIIFGIGWGVGGLCPGPGLAGVALVPAAASIFVIAMLAGMILQRFTADWLETRQSGGRTWKDKIPPPVYWHGMLKGRGWFLKPHRNGS